MNDVFENHLSRAQKVIQFVNDHNDDLGATPAVIATLRPLLNDQVDKALLDDEKVTEDLTGYSAQKNNIRVALESSVMHVASGLISYAEDADDFVLQHSVEFSPSTVQRFRDNRLLSYGDYVHDKAAAAPVAAALATDHNVSAGDLTALQARLDSFTDVIAQPEEKIGERAGWSIVLEQDFENIGTTVDKINSKMQTYRFTNPGMWASWEAVKKIDDTGGQSTPPTFSAGVPAGTEIKAGDITYNPITPVKLKNTGTTLLRFNLKQGGSDAGVLNSVDVNPGAQQNTTMGFMAAEGNEIWVRNGGGDTGTFEITIG